jgi:hypothetical protein
LESVLASTAIRETSSAADEKVPQSIGRAPYMRLRRTTASAYPQVRDINHFPTLIWLYGEWPGCSERLAEGCRRF